MKLKSFLHKITLYHVPKSEDILWPYQLHNPIPLSIHHIRTDNIFYGWE